MRKYSLLLPLFLHACASQLVSSRDSSTNVHSGLRRGAEARDRKALPQTPQAITSQAEGGVAPQNPANTPAVLDSPEVGKYYQNARKLYDEGQVREGLGQIAQYFRTYPRGQFADEAAFLLAKQAMDKNDFSQASKYYEAIIALNPVSKLRGDSIFLRSVCLYNMGQRRDALAVLSSIEIREVFPQTRKQIFPFWGRVASEEGRILESSLAFIKARKEVPEQKTDFEKIIQDQIETQLSEKELEFILTEYPSDFPSGPVQMRLVSIKLAAGDRVTAQALLQSIVALSAAGTPLHSQAQQLLERINSVADVQNKKVGFLLPLSGERKAIGTAFLEGMKIALRDLNPAPFEIVAADAGPTLESSKTAFERLVFEDKVMMVVGPLLRGSADWVAEKSVEYGIPHIALSGKPGLLEKGNYVFTMSLGPEHQVRTLVAHAAQKLNAKRFAILFPENLFGQDVGQSFFKAVEEWGGVVTAADSYPPDEVDFRIYLENMVGKAFPQYRKKEAEENLLKFEEMFTRPPNNKERDSVSLAPIVDFDVLLLPDSSKTVGQIVPALAYSEISGVQLMGPSTWNHRDLLKRAGSYIEGAFFVDSFSIDRKSRVTKDFIEKYKNEKSMLPSSVSAQGHDVGLVLKNVFSDKKSPQSRDDIRRILENLGSFDGVQGVYTWNSKRDTLSEVQLFEIRKNDFVYQGGILTR